MIHRELLDYVKQQLDKGVNREEIKNKLIIEGWTEADINEAFAGLSSPGLKEVVVAAAERGSPKANRILIKIPHWLSYVFGFLIGASLILSLYFIFLSPFFKTKSIDTKSIVEQWGSSVVRIECDDGFGGMYSGSGTLWNIDNTFLVTTNKHVIDPVPDIQKCSVRITPLKGGVSDLKNILTYKPNRKSLKTLEGEFDLVIFSLEESSPDMPLSRLNDYAHRVNKQCNKTIYSPGENILALGYPAVGTREGVALTVNEGIISGIEQVPLAGDEQFMWYVTSAKIEQGNSGGAAIASDGCFVGIPTWSRIGYLESQARLLIFGSENSFARLIIGK